ncbi:hypothetical protein HZU75_13855 [Chitinibacter fontanus]|uniref:Uncharacterized protein n=1 Tax=Chitinibacter fontanus TaxID=1737446 RepID=A0A7D5Z9C3_9NEIS|nr:hypothetical protein [Chitinibacter fontanus]QLI82522.1 hypothetical protein HZU75_13855 [Chitinibacter fontanus]
MARRRRQENRHGDELIIPSNAIITTKARQKPRILITTSRYWAGRQLLSGLLPDTAVGL